MAHDYILPDDPTLRPILGLGPKGRLSPGDPPISLPKKLNPADPSDRVYLDAGLVAVADRREAQVASRNFEAALGEAERELERVRRERNVIDRQRDELRVERDDLIERVAALETQLGESHIAEEDLRGAIAELRQRNADLEALSAPGPWHEAAAKTSLAFANRLVEGTTIPPFKGKGALERALEWLDGQPRPATLEAWRE